MSIYGGPDPKTVDITYPDHTPAVITCLFTGNQYKRLTNKYFKSIGTTRDEYLSRFPDAPLISHEMRSAYKKMWTEDDKERKRQEFLQVRANDPNFMDKQREGWWRFRNSDRFDAERQRLSEKAKKQHATTDLNERVRDYFDTRYEGSDDQKRRSDRMHSSKFNPIFNPESKQKMIESMIKTLSDKDRNVFKQKPFRDTDLLYQSSYELDFLTRCFDIHGLTHDHIGNGPVFTDAGVFYIADFILFGKYVVEIKSWYVEKLQEKNNPGTTAIKRQLVEAAGYTWVYVKDKNYTEVDDIIRHCVV